MDQKAGISRQQQHENHPQFHSVFFFLSFYASISISNLTPSAQFKCRFHEDGQKSVFAPMSQHHTGKGREISMYAWVSITAGANK